MTIFWVTETIGTSMRDYYDKRRYGPTIGPGDFVTVPTAVAVFANELVSEGSPPREWAERLYDVRRWTPMPRGGHFAGRGARPARARHQRILRRSARRPVTPRTLRLVLPPNPYPSASAHRRRGNPQRPFRHRATQQHLIVRAQVETTHGSRAWAASRADTPTRSPSRTRRRPNS